jgi:hypothetical protein
MVAILVVGGDHRGVKVHRMHHRRGCDAYAWYGLVGAIRHREFDAVSDAGAHDRPGRLIAERPGRKRQRVCAGDAVGAGAAMSMHFDLSVASMSKAERSETQRNVNETSPGKGSR